MCIPLPPPLRSKEYLEPAAKERLLPSRSIFPSVLELPIPYSLFLQPDGTQRRLIGDIIKRFEQRGYKLVGLKMVMPTEDFARQHDADLSRKPFFPGLVKFFSSGAVVAMVWEGE